VQTVDLQAVLRGPDGNVAKKAINASTALRRAEPEPGGALIAAENADVTTGGDVLEDDESYRALLLGRPRTLWTLEAVRAAVKQIDGVRDCRLFDPAGGVDVSLSKFNLFAFNTRKFGVQRSLDLLISSTCWWRLSRVTCGKLQAL